MKIAITGATGLLGRNLLFEIIKQNINNLDMLEIFILGRSQGKTTIEQRIQQIILEDGLSYLSLDEKQREKVKNYSKTGTKCIDMDLSEQRLAMTSEDIKLLKSTKIDFFFHIAALTDFRNTPKVKNLLIKTNIEGTKQILDLVKELKVREFCYTGTAYACGEIAGNIKPDYINFEQKFRNTYEKTKLEAEVLIRSFARKSKIRCRYFRLSTISGRLMEQPLGAVNKFDVFYSWAAFFLYLKLKRLENHNNKYNNSVNFDVRICYRLNSGLNIVPADYAAKVMYQACMQNDKGESYHLVNTEETPHALYIPIMLTTINVKGIKQVDHIPNQMNHLEKLYYKTAGQIFTPYITSDPMLFDAQSLKNILNKSKLYCPPVDRNNFTILMDYAKKYDFGIT